jgi:hypothetical protein
MKQINDFSCSWVFSLLLVIRVILQPFYGHEEARVDNVAVQKYSKWYGLQALKKLFVNDIYS